MTSSRPYMVRALYEWIIDNDMTPYLLVDAMVADVQVPQQFIEDGKIVLNISPSATEDMILGNQLIEFSARFSGAEQIVSVPTEAVLAIYARENGQGMLFADENDQGTTPPDDEPPSPSNKPQLRVVK